MSNLTADGRIIVPARRTMTRDLMELASRISFKILRRNVRRLACGEHVLRLDVGAVQADGALTPDLAVNQPPPIIERQ